MQGECVTVRRVSVVVKTLLHCQKRLLSFQKEQLFVFNDKQSTQYHKKTFLFDERNEDTATMRVATSQKTGDRSFKSNLKLINSI